jgi:hypothetical protein
MDEPNKNHEAEDPSADTNSNSGDNSSHAVDVQIPVESEEEEDEEPLQDSRHISTEQQKSDVKRSQQHQFQDGVNKLMENQSRQTRKSTGKNTFLQYTLSAYYQTHICCRCYCTCSYTFATST